MKLSSKLMKDFSDTVNVDTGSANHFAFGTVIKQNNRNYVSMDGGNSITSLSAATEVEDGDRILLLMKNHTATAVGNFTSSVSGSGRTAADVATQLSNEVTRAKQAESSIESSIENLPDKLGLLVSDGSLGNTVSVQLMVDGIARGTANSIDLTNVRQAFADDSSDITVHFGTVKFEEGTFAVDTETVSSTPNIHINPDGLLQSLVKFSKNNASLVSVMSASDIDDMFDIPVRWVHCNLLDSSDERSGTAIPSLIAEDIEEVMPIAVDHDNSGNPETWNSQIMIPLIFEMLKSDHERIVALEERVAQLEEG